MSRRTGRFFTATALAVASLAFAPAARAQAAPPGPHKGLGVGMRGDNDGVQVVTLLPGSPAEKVGVKIGDQVVSVAGIAIFDFDPDQMRSIADTAKTIAFVVMRNGQKITFQIEPAVINLPGGAPGAGVSGGAAPR